MITKEELKKEIDNLPDHLLEEIFAILKKAKKELPENFDWSEWKENLKKFTPDFMSERIQPSATERESFD